MQWLRTKVCFKNWDGSSCGMEADMIVEEFQNAESMHMVRYMRMVGDGSLQISRSVFWGGEDMSPK